MRQGQLVLVDSKELETMMKPGEWKTTTMEYQDRSNMVMTSTKQETIYRWIRRSPQ